MTRLKRPSHFAWRAAVALRPDARACVRALAAGDALQLADLPLQLLIDGIAECDLVGPRLSAVGLEVARILGPRCRGPKEKAGAGDARPASQVRGEEGAKSAS